MLAKNIERINELAKKSKTPGGLTPEEKIEQAALRKEYIEGFRQSLIAQLDNTVVVEPDGTKRKLVRKEEPEKEK